MATRERLDRQAGVVSARLIAELVETSEQVDRRMGTYLLAALTAELCQRIQDRCHEEAQQGGAGWTMAAAEAETAINAAWRLLESIAALSGQFQSSWPTEQGA